MDLVWKWWCTLTLGDAVKELSKRSKLTYKTWAKMAGGVTEGVIDTVIRRNSCTVLTLMRLANAAGYDILLVRKHQLEHEEPIVIDKVGK